MFKKLFNRNKKKEQGMPFTWYHNIFESVVHMTPEERDAKYDSVWKRDFALGWKPFREIQEVAAYKGAFLGLSLLESICDTEEEAIEFYKTWVHDMAYDAWKQQDEYLALL